MFNVEVQGAVLITVRQDPGWWKPYLGSCFHSHCTMKKSFGDSQVALITSAQQWHILSLTFHLPKWIIYPHLTPKNCYPTMCPKGGISETFGRQHQRLPSSYNRNYSFDFGVCLSGQCIEQCELCKASVQKILSSWVLFQMEGESFSHSQGGLGLPVQGLLKNHWGRGLTGGGLD